MTQRLAEMRVRIGSVRQLGSAITALRGIAASHVQQSRGRLAGVRAYSEIITGAISQALPLLDAMGDVGHGKASGPVAMILFCAELGFAGSFSEDILDHAAPGGDGALLLCVGSRGINLARSRQLRLDWSLPMISQVGGVARLAGSILAALDQRIREGRIARAEMVFKRPIGSGNELETLCRPLLPVDLARIGRRRQAQPPLVNLVPRMLVEQLAAEYLFAQISEAILHSFAAENAARLMAMAAAKDNIDRKLDALSLEERRARQAEITDEVIELSAGTSALAGN